MHRLPVALLLALTLVIAPTIATAQRPSPTISSTRNDWRPLVYNNLQSETSTTAAYSELWSKEILENNKAYIARGDMRWAYGNAPAIEGHFVVRSPTRSAVLSILDTGTGCIVKSIDKESGAIVKMCPLITAVYEGSKVTVTRGRKACFLEMVRQNRSDDPANTASYAAYDLKTRSFKIGTIINHQLVAGCSATIPIDELPL